MPILRAWVVTAQSVVEPTAALADCRLPSPLALPRHTRAYVSSQVSHGPRLSHWFSLNPPPKPCNLEPQGYQTADVRCEPSDLSLLASSCYGLTMPTMWRPLPPFSNGLPPLFVSPSFGASAYTLHVTDLANVWSETLERKAIFGRSLQ